MSVRAASIPVMPTTPVVAKAPREDGESPVRTLPQAPGDRF